MIKMKLLICICYHHCNDQGLNILFKNIYNIKNNYSCEYKIIIHTNSDYSKELINNSHSDIEVIVCSKLDHPFYLTWQHRTYIKNNFSLYDVCMYLEDDMILNYSNLLNYLKNLEHVWPNYVPTFLRYEENNILEKYAVDTHRISLKKCKVLNLNEMYLNVGKIYSACWVLPSKFLKGLIDKNFTIIRGGQVIRETAASFVNWQLGKQCILQLDKDIRKISDKSLIHHASNKYINLIQPHFSKFKVSDLIY